MRNVLSIFLILVPIAAQAQDRADRLLSRMTLEEKLGQLTQLVPDQPEFPSALEKGLVGSILNDGGAAKTNAMQRSALAASRLKIPLLFAYDVIHGYRTIFPIPLAIASSWDPQLAELSARVAAREARSAGIRWTFAPMVDIARDARWGRIAEGAG
jgi:beta-glucosidase